jgi:hypothetical protein
MVESISFWLENRNCAGTKAALMGDQVLVFYRDRYYVVEDGASKTKGGKPIRFSTSSLPSVWKRALKGDVESTVTSSPGTDSVPITHTPRRERKKAEKSVMPELQQETSMEKSEKAPPLVEKVRRKIEAKPVTQQPVVANCPYCNSRHEIPVEKGKNGKSFFIPCNRCKNEFAVRFVQVTVYQAQVAGFR